MMSEIITAGIIIIGNEILSGKVADVNSHFMACELRELGVDLRRIVVIPDDIDIIGKEVLSFSQKYNYVFTSGGIGPTHDDVTMEGIAGGFGVKLTEHPEIKEILVSKYNDLINDAVLKMTMVPEGSKVDFSENLRFPVVSFKNIFIFPGIPEYLKNKFPLIKEKIRTSAFYLKSVYLNCHESHIAESLNMIVDKHPDVTFGSYPVTGNSEFLIKITADSKSEEHLKKAFEEFLAAISPDIIVKVE